MKKTLFTLFLALAASVGTLFAESGTCGENLTWDLTGGVLTISGTGAMTDYAYDNHAPWYANRESITSVTIGNGVTSIGDYAFYECRSLTAVTIPNSVTSIGLAAFNICSSLTAVTIPNSVTSIGLAAFTICSSLNSIDVASENSNYSSVDGVLFNKDKTELIQYPIGNARTEYTIPNSVTSIGEYAFYECSSLTAVTIPNSVTSIGGNAFNRCSSLTSVTIPNSVTSIGYSAFYNCSSLTSVTIPNSVTSIEDIAFESCISLTSITIPASVISIGDGAFAYCSSLTSVTIPNSVSSIGVQAFRSCISLTSITCEATTPPTCGDNAFYNVPQTIPVYVPAASVDDYKAANQWKDFGENIQAIPTQTKEMTPGIAHLSWDETNQQWSITAYDDGANPKFVFAFAADGAKTSLPAALSVTNLTGAMYVFADTEDSKFECTIKDATVTITYDGTGYQYNSVGGQYYVNAKIKGEMSDAYGNKLIVKEPTDFIKVYVPSDVATGINKVQSDQVPSTKVLRDGQIFILRGDRTYTLQGQEIK